MMSNPKRQPFWQRLLLGSQPTPQRVPQRLPSRPSHDRRPTAPPAQLEPEPQPKPTSPTLRPSSPELHEDPQAAPLPLPPPSSTEELSPFVPSAPPPQAAPRLVSPSEQHTDSQDASQPTPQTLPSHLETPSHPVISTTPPPSPSQVKAPYQLASPTSSPPRVARTPAPSPERRRESLSTSQPTPQPLPTHPEAPSHLVTSTTTPPTPSRLEAPPQLATPTSSPRKFARTATPSPERHRDSSSASTPALQPSPSHLEAPSHLVISTKQPPSSSDDETLSQLVPPQKQPPSPTHVETPSQLESIKQAPSPTYVEMSPQLATSPKQPPSPSYAETPSQMPPLEELMPSPSRTHSKPETETKLRLSKKSPTPSPRRVPRTQTPSPPPSPLRTITHQPSGRGLKTKTPTVVRSRSPSPLPATPPSLPHQVVAGKVDSHPTAVEPHHPQTTQIKQPEEETESKFLGEESRASLEIKDTIKTSQFAPIEDKTKEAIEQKTTEAEREKPEESAPTGIKDKQPAKPQTSEGEMLPLHLVEQKREDEPSAPKKFQLTTDKRKNEMKISTPPESRMSDKEVRKEKGTNIAVSDGPEHSSAQDKRSMHMEIKDGLSKLVHKLNFRHPQTPGVGDAVTIITLAGENRGATMVLGSEIIDREDFVRIQGQNLQKKDIHTTSDTKETKARGMQSMLANVNCNVQSINNSLMQESSFNDNDPGVHLVLSSRATEPSELKAETFRTTATTTPAQNVAYDPNIRRRCLRGLFLDSEDEKEDPQKPRRHGCRYSCDEKKGKAVQDRPSTMNAN